MDGIIISYPSDIYPTLLLLLCKDGHDEVLCSSNNVVTLDQIIESSNSLQPTASFRTRLAGAHPQLEDS